VGFALRTKVQEITINTIPVRYFEPRVKIKVAHYSNNARLLDFHDRCTIHLANKSLHAPFRLRLPLYQNSLSSRPSTLLPNNNLLYIEADKTTHHPCQRDKINLSLSTYNSDQKMCITLKLNCKAALLFN
jgi:hypothetical protein